MQWVAVFFNVRRTPDGWSAYVEHNRSGPSKCTAAGTSNILTAANIPVRRRHCVENKVCNHPVPHFRFPYKVSNALDR